MKKINLTIALTCLLCMSSCVYSLFPIYTEDTIVYLPKLNGTYINGNTTITFEPGAELEINSLEITSDDPDEFYVHNGDTLRDMKLISKAITQEIEEEQRQKTNFYKMTLIEKNTNKEKEIQEFRSHLVKIGEELFLDLYPYENEKKLTDSEKQEKYVFSNLIPVHTFMKINIENQEIVMTQFNLTKLRDLFKSNLIRLRHELVENEVLITAQPKEIQKFIEKYSKDPSVFDDTETYKRVAL